MFDGVLSRCFLLPRHQCRPVQVFRGFKITSQISYSVGTSAISMCESTFTLLPRDRLVFRGVCVRVHQLRFVKDIVIIVNQKSTNASRRPWPPNCLKQPTCCVSIIRWWFYGRANQTFCYNHAIVSFIRVPNNWLLPYVYTRMSWRILSVTKRLYSFRNLT